MIKLSDPNWVLQIDPSENNRIEIYHNPCINQEHKLEMDGWVSYATNRPDNNYRCYSCGVHAPLGAVRAFKFIVGNKKQT